MNKWTLTFNEKAIETNYRKNACVKNFGLFRANFLLISLITAYLTVNAFIFNQYALGIVYLLSTVNFNLQIMLAQKWPSLLDWQLLIYQITTNGFFIYVVVFQQIEQNIIREFNSYVGGCTLTYFILQANFGSRFYFKAIMVSINVITMIISEVSSKQIFLSINILFMVGGIMLIIQIYNIDRINREAYLSFMENKVWSDHLDSNVNIGSIKCSLNDNKSSIKYTKGNAFCRKILNITDQQDFVNFCRNTQVIRALQNKSTKKIGVSLEFLAFYILNGQLINYIDKYIQYAYDCVFEGQNFNVKMLISFENTNILTMLVRKTEVSHTMKQMQEKLVFQNQIQNYVINNTQTILLQSQYHLQAMDQLILQRDVSLHLNLTKNILIRQVCENLNIMIYQDPEEVFKSKFLKEKSIIHFDLISFLRAFLQNQQHVGILLSFNNCAYLQHLPFRQNLQVLYLILSNLFDTIISKKHENKSEEQKHISIKLTHIQKNGMTKSVLQPLQSELKVFNISISTNITNISILQKHQVTSLNPNQHSQFIDANLFKQVKFNLAVARYLVGKIGPKCKIKYLKHEKHIEINFNIYDNIGHVNLRDNIKSKASGNNFEKYISLLKY